MKRKEILGTSILGAAFAGAALLVAVLFFAPQWASLSRQGAFPPLHQAARAGNTGEVTVLLAGGAGIETLDRGPNGWTPLLHAVHKDQLAVVRLLLARGADPNRLAVNGTSPLNLAASQGDLETVRVLLAAGARVSGYPGTCAVLNAATGGHRQVVETLLAAAPGLRVPRGPRYWVARLLARVRGDRQMLALLGRAEARS